MLCGLKKAEEGYRECWESSYQGLPLFQGIIEISVGKKKGGRNAGYKALT